ncbi:Outer membrane protein, OmpA/MotB family protein [Oceanicola granulosus HTCC2516]|uniref:Outer membrane protein, OmpA/MotB family protein n=1 Tax=Oceanicola granulosus (strain ATCC BAA-861 / DSM 15982 / KCTC 12143 / HTCC2516) TaxID=314256 RepID=Q2CJG4_OCEGH|nr:OmpA family protein [Oceanicola granulosus]EAR52636.1 Outer membrane protein, OmpA/MotB family protein [Oceanicola granulosus HTCC2516]
MSRYRSTTAMVLSLALATGPVPAFAQDEAETSDLPLCDGMTFPCVDLEGEVIETLPEFEAATDAAAGADSEMAVEAEDGEFPAEGEAEMSAEGEAEAEPSADAVTEEVDDAPAPETDGEADVTVEAEDAPAPEATENVEVTGEAGAEGEAEVMEQVDDAPAPETDGESEMAEAPEAGAEVTEEAGEASPETDAVPEAEAATETEAATEAEVEAEEGPIGEATDADSDTPPEGDAEADIGADTTAESETPPEPEADAAAETGEGPSAEDLAEELSVDDAAAPETDGESEAEAEVTAPETEAEAETGAEVTDTGAEAETDSSTEATGEAPAETSEEEAAEASAPIEALAASESAESGEEVVTEEVTEETVRSSDEDFETTASGDGDDEGLSNFERFLLLGLGAVAVGSVLDDGGEVVSNTGDRVVIERDGRLYVLKDDDVLLRQPGAEVQTVSFADGSTRTIVTRDDGSQVVTIRAADGTVVRRERIMPDGTRVILFDDTTDVAPVDVTALPDAPQPRDVSLSDEEALLAALAASNASYDRTFSLRQIRQIKEVRALAPEIALEEINFETASAAIRPEEAEELAALGQAITAIIRENPRAVFLIEGHTDAVGNASYNLALSDRRAESVALALTEYFGVPPENLVTQGYGESQLLVPTAEAERANRRAAVRNITGLLG